MRKLNPIVPLLFAWIATAPCFAQSGNTNTKQEAKPATETLTEKSVNVAELLDAEAFKPKFLDTTTAPTTIAFGSCNRVTMSQSMWDHVAVNNPNLWIWLGDIIYADTADMKALAAHYRRLKTNPEYKKLRDKTQIIGIYDDHDYGFNDACKYYPMKRSAKKCLMDFLDIPLNSPVRKRDGAYQSYTFGKVGQKNKSNNHGFALVSRLPCARSKQRKTL
jgi:hypothetical protein